MSGRFKRHRSGSSTESTPTKSRAPGSIDFVISDDKRGAMGFRFDKNMTELIDVLKSFKLRGVKVMSWHPQFRWWGIVAYESPGPVTLRIEEAGPKKTCPLITHPHRTIPPGG